MGGQKRASKKIPTRGKPCENLGILCPRIKLFGLNNKFITQKDPSKLKSKLYDDNLNVTSCFPFARSLQKKSRPLTIQEYFLIKEILQGGQLGRSTNVKNIMGYRGTKNLFPQ